jgi:hypothetical protein
MDDEAKQLLREIRGHLVRSESRRMVVYSILLALMLAVTACTLFLIGQERERARRESVRNWIRADGTRPPVESPAE